MHASSELNVDKSIVDSIAEITKRVIREDSLEIRTLPKNKGIVK
ncbi:MAG: hypothetical protein NTU57_00355 [Candidatus Aenigmarchaeota archaeon]|nr:hypothetical protein [Candidatus Aenigmarchaeota archaeon]